jgi:putative sterol carrier protein
VARFLSEEWIDALGAALGDSDEVPKDVELTIQQVVTNGEEVKYWTRLAGGKAEAGLGDAPAADVTITQDLETAAALSRAEINHQAAFMQGKLKVTGNMGKLLQHQEIIASLAPVMASIPTEY